MTELALGVMSGTSADGVTAALGVFGGHNFEIKGFYTEPYPNDVVRRIRLGGSLPTKELSGLNVDVGVCFARAALQLLKKTNTKPDQVLCIGSHGQTLYHGPTDSPPNTLQIGEPAVIAEKTGIPVVSHFRQKDMAAGGQGAPLIPFFDQYFYGQGTQKAMLNIGGIANVTVVGKDSDPLAFDTGPGNSLMDRAMRIISQDKEHYDHQGRLAKQGQMDMTALDQMMKHPYFHRKPPKSTGPEMFGDEFLKDHIGKILSTHSANAMATLNYFTCITIQESFRSFIFNKYKVSEIIVSGGGVFNKTLIKKLECLFAPIPTVSIEKKGVPPLAKEPLAFAFYGLRCMQNKVNHIPACTGAKKACVLGSVTKP